MYLRHALLLIKLYEMSDMRNPLYRVNMHFDGPWYTGIGIVFMYISVTRISFSTDLSTVHTSCSHQGAACRGKVGIPQSFEMCPCPIGPNALDNRLWTSEIVHAKGRTVQLLCRVRRSHGGWKTRYGFSLTDAESPFIIPSSPWSKWLCCVLMTATVSWHCWH